MDVKHCGIIKKGFNFTDQSIIAAIDMADNYLSDDVDLKGLLRVSLAEYLTK
jgi:hypothetical protein